MEEKRDQNRRLVTECALELFLEKGVDNVTIREVAERSGLTERSVYRYFYTRADLVLATSFLFWDGIKAEVEKVVSDSSYRGMKGIEQIKIMLRFYSSLFLESPKSVRYILGAEMSLKNSGVTIDIKDRPPGRYEDSDTPLAHAIKAGIADGSVSPDVDHEEIYYMLYDAILGTMQRMALGATTKEDTEHVKKRMEHLCSMFIAAFEGKI